MMKKSILSFVLVLMWVSSAMSKNVSDMFIDMPDTVMPYISREQRIDLVNMRRIDTQTPATVKSVFRSDVSLTELADDRLTNEDGSFQYALIRLSGNGADSLFCELCTVQPVYSTTSCHIYDGNWNLVGKIDFDDFVSHFSNYTEEEAERLKLVEFPIVKVTVDSDVSLLHIEVRDPLPYKDENDRNGLILQRNVKWDGESFKEF